jgi:hypothetical protein
MLWPIVNFGELASASYEGDARLIIWTLAWNNHAVLTGAPLFDSNIFYPAERSLAYNEHLFGLGLFTLPIYAATRNPVLAHNVALVGSFVLNGLAAHALLKRLTAHHVAAAAGSIVYTFSFYKMLHAHGHLHLVWTWLIPLSILWLERWRERPSAGRASLWAAAVALQALTSWYLAVLTILTQSVAGGAVLWRLHRERRVKYAWQLAAAAMVAAIVVWPFAQPYRSLRKAPAHEASRHAADLAAYVVPPEHTWLGQQWLRYIGPGPRSVWGERTLYVGWLALLLAGAGVCHGAAQRRWRVMAAAGVLTVVAFTLSLGPSERSWSLFEALAALPGVGALRAPARFSLLVLLGVSIFAALGADLVCRRARHGPLVVAALMPFMLAEWFVIGFPAGRPRAFDIPPIYRVDALADGRPLVALPDYRDSPQWFKGADYLFFSTLRWPPLVNGFGRTEPPGHRRVISHMMAFPGPNNARTMRRLGVAYVIVHGARYPDGARDLLRVALASPEYTMRARVGSDYLFEVRPAEPGIDPPLP